MLFTIDKLFAANISSKLYFDIFLVVAGIFSLGYFLSGIPGQRDEIQPDSYPKVLRILLQSIVMPLTAAYSAILYAYFIKILATWNWPAGIVSNLVLWFSIICAAVIFLIYGLKERNKWTQLYMRWMPILLLPLMAMMFVSIGIRISEYGVTENRYYVVAAGIWTTAYMLYLNLRRSPRNIVLPASLALIALLAVVGPISSFSISKWSQNARFEKVLLKNGMLRGNEVVKPVKALTDKDKNDIAGIVQYFAGNHELKDITLLPDQFSLEKSEDTFGFDIYAQNDPINRNTGYFNHYLSEEGHVFDIREYDFYLEFPYFKQTKITSEQANLAIIYSSSDRKLEISREGKVLYSGKPDEIAVEIHKANQGIEALSQDKMSYKVDNASLRLLFVFRNINGSEDQTTGIATANVPEFNLFVKVKD
jgi:hypothetical protein